MADRIFTAFAIEDANLRTVEIFVPLIFLAVHALQFAFNVPWAFITRAAACLFGTS